MRSPSHRARRLTSRRKATRQQRALDQREPLELNEALDAGENPSEPDTQPRHGVLVRKP